MNLHSSSARISVWLCSFFTAWLLLSPVHSRTWQADYSAAPDGLRLLATEMAILDPSARVDHAAAAAAGRTWLAYVSLVEVSRKATYASDAAKKGVKYLAENKEWSSRMVDISSPRWADYVVDTLARGAVQRGFRGFFLDTVDSWQILAREFPEKKETYRKALISIILRLHSTFPDKEIVMNRGFELLPDVRTAIQGVMIESVFHTFDKDGRYLPTSDTTRKALTERIASLRQAGLNVYGLDYAEPGNAAAIEESVKLLTAAGAEPFVSTRELQGMMLGPVKEKPRRLLVLFGHVLAESESAESFAADTFTAERLQTPLEWMGYEVDYVNVGKVSPAVQLDGRYAGIILDTHLQLPYAGEEWYVDWLLAHRQRGLKLIFCGNYPLAQDLQRARLFKGLGCWGSFVQVPAPQQVELRTVDKSMMDFEAKTTAHPAEVQDTRAPDGAQVYLSVTSRDAAANVIQFDPVYTCSWGGALLDPYATFQVSADDQASLFNPFAFLEKLFPPASLPAPDTSTRNGRRIFYSHIDGDGFQVLTKFAGQQVCGEIVRDEILKKYPFPVTVSLIEANIMGLEDGQKASDRERLEPVARDIFQMPNIQAASHSYSHPYVWIDNDEEYIPQYESRQMVLRKGFEVKRIDAEREVAGSVAYVNSLCPPGKRAEIMLWSGNCRPSPEALRVCDRLGIENMNGGGAPVTRRHPFLANVEPRTMQWDGELQIYGAHQNEFVYTKNWRGPFYGGFAQVIESFDLTEKPRRLKPVNIYYHFYSTATEGAMAALKKVHDWSLAQPLHSVTAREYAAISRDSHRLRIFTAGPQRFVIAGNGSQRTFRLPARGPLPDLAASSGITGWVQEGNALYIHTDGRPCVTLALAENPAVPLYLESSQGAVTWHRRESAELDLTITELRPTHTLVLAGARGDGWVLTVNDSPVKLAADASGRLVIPLSGNARVKLKRAS